MIAREFNTDNITVNTQSSIRIAGSDVVVRFDPFRISGNPNDADIIFFTHEHYDHFSLDDIERVRKPDTIYVAPKTMEGELQNIGINDAILFGTDERKEVAGIQVEAVPAYNTDKSFHQKYKGWLGYVVTIDGIRYYIAGDTDVTPESETVVCDVAFVPIGGSYTMNAKQAAELINAIKPKAAIPTHYGSIVGSRSDENTFRSYVDSSIQVVSKLF
ncbi:MAG: MBL fold metallo-hydrolase [Ruminiclostridium sp.]|nr:MBL fold metallo-hydrolase [Ruminiclostridium sp.]